MAEKLIPVLEIPELEPFASRATIFRWIHSGILEAKRIGNRYYTTQAAVDKLLRGEVVAEPRKGRG